MSAKGPMLMTTHAEPRLARRLDIEDQAVLFPVLADEAPISGPIVSGIREERRSPRGVVSSFFSCGRPEESLLYVGAGIVPFRMQPGDAETFADSLVSARYTKASIHGRADNVLSLWNALEPAWGPAKDIRPTQMLLQCKNPKPAPMTSDARTRVGPLRLASPGEIDRVLPAAAAMYEEELGANPLTAPYAAAYHQRVYRYLLNRQTWICDLDRGAGIAFKVDVVGREYSTATIQGVWTNPMVRGSGIATSAVASLCRILRAENVVPSLVVNSYNTAARRVYERCGFEHTADYATVMF